MSAPLKSKGKASRALSPEALSQARAEMSNLTMNELRVINVDPERAIALARRTLPRVRTIELELRRTIQTFNPAWIDQLEIYAAVLEQAHAKCIAPKQPAPNPSTPYAKAIEMRARLLADATCLAARGHFSSARLDGLKGTNGYLHTASDLLCLAEILRDCWPQIANKTPVTEAELDQAEGLGIELIHAVGARSHSDQALDSDLIQRRQAYTQFVRLYEEIRAAVIYVRRHEADADRIAPTLYSKGKRPPAHEPSAAVPSQETRKATEVGGSRSERKPARTPGSDPRLN